MAPPSWRNYSRAEDEELVQFLRSRNFQRIRGERIYKDLAIMGVVVRRFKRSFKSLKARFETLVKNRTDLMTTYELSLCEPRKKEARTVAESPTSNSNPRTPETTSRNLLFDKTLLQNLFGLDKCSIDSERNKELLFEELFDKELEKDSTIMIGLSRKPQRKRFEKQPQPTCSPEPSVIDLTTSPDSKRPKMEIQVKSEPKENVGDNTKQDSHPSYLSVNRIGEPASSYEGTNLGDLEMIQVVVKSEPKEDGGINTRNDSDSTKVGVNQIDEPAPSFEGHKIGDYRGIQTVVKTEPKEDGGDHTANEDNCTKESVNQMDEPAPRCEVHKISDYQGIQTVVKTEPKEDVGDHTANEDNCTKEGVPRMDIIASSCEDKTVEDAKKIHSEVKSDSKHGSVHRMDKTSPSFESGQVDHSSEKPGSAQVGINEIINLDVQQSCEVQPAKPSGSKLETIDQQVEKAMDSETGNDNSPIDRSRAAKKCDAINRLQFMNAKPTEENRKRALTICGVILDKVFIAEKSPLPKYKLVTECVYFNILNQTQSLKLLCTKFGLKFELTKLGNDRCKETVESIVGYWADERLELRDLSRSCMSVLLLANELLHPTVLTHPSLFV